LVYEKATKSGSIKDRLAPCQGKSLSSVYRRLTEEPVQGQYVKFVLKLEPQANAVGTEPVELAFLDCESRFKTILPYSPDDTFISSSKTRPTPPSPTTTSLSPSPLCLGVRSSPLPPHSPRLPQPPQRSSARDDKGSHNGSILLRRCR
jgi:hypothetical protein